MTTKQITFPSIESKQIFICDFNDSFTYNIFSDFENLGFQCEVKKHTDLDFWSDLKNKKDKYILVLGPGPGHPRDYDFSCFSYFFNLDNCFIFGICLGHQLSLMFLGADIIESSNKLHGQVVDLYDNSNFFFSDEGLLSFQRYNSLTVDLSSLQFNGFKALYDDNSELMLFSHKNLISCQFHPESVGTNCPKSLYYLVTKFLIQ